ncbi:MAG: hypothetical protein A2043_04345 [Candidatus Schekmanbacteria bacterium GWA2_38_9]|uniref:Guanylate cyclase domain-containing protein n=1 Tax=Candidatus Schekmanbacteria bacterium RIFCSPLOWO2_12_FULL_38_15 TaxID=1817883 RepID=A0A1F7SIN8_9BACT|nr:MAG: hypothetical protein A2043_04345 [Candidatus Schekmanbacteria bacterium GWA2_38_9]OGL49730.1 MAG: hypothetical protein A3H37_01735 [Candidatus Schekmanbacteria bacterium RIFCSPLOWO2_02_FULL_38_14]OGL53084.1 MAG: hypothetical protein A3G31_09290 [Candidatus Schekmanbacteria bacterium RIFCSPLOWO2_12_FULL_38_15]
MHGEVIEYLKSDGAKAIGFDIIFSERAVRKEIDSKVIDELRTFAQNADIPEVRNELLRQIDSLMLETSDLAFVSSVKQAINIFQSMVFYVDEDDLLHKRGLEAEKSSSANIKSILSKSALSVSKSCNSRMYFNATIPFEELAVVSCGVGYINVFPDNDGTIRKFYPFLFFKDRKKAYPFLPILIAAYTKDIPLDSIRADKGSMFIGGSILPLLSDGSAMIYYQGGKIRKDKTGKEIYQSFYTYIPYDYVLASKDLVMAGMKPPLEKGTFKDKIVLVSASAAGLTDLRATPFSPVTPGIEIHANIIDNILSKKFLYPLNSFFEKLYIFFLASAIALISRFIGPYRGFFIVALIACSALGIHWMLFEKGIVLSIVSPVVAMAATYLATLLLKYALEFKEKNYIKTAFGHYIAPAVLEEVLISPEKLRLGGERKYMTVLFSDVENFTSLSEKLPPDEIGPLLNEYLSGMVQCIMQTNGTLDKFIGDAVMAFWNAPHEQKDHASLACETALLMEKELKRLREEWGKEKKPLLNARIGINTGEMTVGNMGSKEILDYTVLGLEVNTAARLEPLNKDFGTRIIVSHSTCIDAEKTQPGRFVFRRLARVVLKGREKPLEVYELIGFRDEVSRERLDLIKMFETGLALFLDFKFSDAKACFQKTLDMDNQDSPSKTYLSLCQYYEKTPPPPNSDLTYMQISK